MNEFTKQLLAAVVLVGSIFSVVIVGKRFLGAFNTITGAVNDKTKGFLDRGKKGLAGRAERRDKYKQAIKQDRLGEWASRDKGLRKAYGRAALRSASGMNTFGLGTKRSRDQMSRGLAGAQQKRIQEKTAEADAQLQSESIYSSKDGLADAFFDTRRSEVERRAIYNRLVTLGADEQLRQIEAGRRGANQLDVAGARIHAGSKISKEYVSAFKEKAPDLVKGAGAGFDGFTAADVDSWTEDTIRNFRSHVERLQSSTNPADQAQASKISNEFAMSMRNILADDQRRSNLGSKKTYEILEFIGSSANPSLHTLHTEVTGAGIPHPNGGAPIVVPNFGVAGHGGDPDPPKPAGGGPAPAPAPNPYRFGR